MNLYIFNFEMAVKHSKSAQELRGYLNQIAEVINRNIGFQGPPQNQIVVESPGPGNPVPPPNVQNPLPLPTDQNPPIAPLAPAQPVINPPVN